jgi:excinuclease ABC subunit C
LPAVRALPAEPGVYRFRDGRGRALYIGRAVELRRRVASYWGDLRDRRHLRRMIPRIASVEGVSCDSEHEAAWLERNLLEQAKPPWNRTRGVESTVYIGLMPRVEVRHDPGAEPVFGPYLGGEKVRLAVSGLYRALGLAYAGDTMGGFDRDMGRARGVEPGSRPRLLAEVSAVLGRDLEAAERVRAALALRRDAAASSLAFELAGRVQAEVEALDWVLAEQKVTGPDDGTELDIHGWSGGVLVTFQVRRGRVRSWTQRPCAEAPERVAATPERWRAFADRNAALAAALAAR